MSSGPSAGMAEVAAMSESAFCKRFRSSYKSSPSVSPPDIPSRKRYHGTSKLVEDSKEDDDEEDEEIYKSMYSDSVSEDAKDEGPIAEDEDPAAEDEGLTTGGRGPRVESDGIGLEEEEEVVPGGQQQAAPVVGTTVSTPLGLGYEALRRQSERPERVSAFRQPTLTTWIDPEDATPAAVETKGFLTELGAQVKMQGGLISDHAVRLEELSPNLFERSLEYEQERVAVTFRAIWRPVLALEA
ncbi:hypothetical protein Tco_1498744 [Tanacetum coccineum]